MDITTITINTTKYYIKDNKVMERFTVSTQDLSERIIILNMAQRFAYADGFKTLKDVINYMKKYYK